MKHKFDFISLIDKKCKLHLIGHSIGAWIVIEMLHSYSELPKRVITANLLFPTLQRMVETTNGIFLNGVIRRLHIFIMLFLGFINLLPESVKYFILSLFCKFHSLPQDYIARILMYLNPKIMEKVLFLAYDEMAIVRSLNVDALDKIKHFTNVVYSNSDGWAPVNYIEDLKQFQPQLHMAVVDIDHAFVLKSSEKVAEIVADCVKNRNRFGAIN